MIEIITAASIAALILLWVRYKALRKRILLVNGLQQAIEELSKETTRAKRAIKNATNEDPNG